MTVAQRIWLTPAAREKLEEELETLKRAMADVVDDEDANAVAVRRAQQGRIQEIHELLVNAVVGEAPPNDGVAEPGMVVTVRFGDTDDTETFLLGVRGADYGDIEVYSMSSPLGAAIDGARVGETRSYQLPTGGIQEVTLLRAVPYGLHD
jgi:transcription elongation factor GreA